MTVKKITVRNFRNIKQIEIEPDGGTNVIFGDNAQGKTNFLEALWLFTGEKSFRGGKDSEFIKFGEDAAKTDILFQKDGIENEAQMEITDRRRVIFNNSPLKTPAELAGRFCAIVFSPADISLIKDGPAGRRRFLDAAIFQLYPRYGEISKRYIRALAQRNKLLKDIYFHPELSSLLSDFNEELSKTGAEIIKFRRRYIELLSNSAPEIYGGVSKNRETLTIEYDLSCSEEELRSALQESEKEDIKTGSTSVGPHRDDLSILINQKSARLYGSQGQKRSGALALKLAEAEILKSKTGEETVALLDDVMSELDPDRQNFILNHIKNWQVFITCCDPSAIKNLKAGRVIEIKNGSVV